jgi:putative transposase
MSWIRIWVHLVFSTKNRENLLHKEIREKLHNHIVENAKQKDIWLDSIGGYSDHLHCLVSLGRDQTISKVAQLIKGESSFWLNKNNYIQTKFQWQDDYWAVSVGESHLNAVRKYISNQDEHHNKLTFKEEVDDFMDTNGWNIIKNI